MRISTFLKRLSRDEDGGPLVEATVIFPFLIVFLFGAVDFMNAFRQWSAAAKAVELGARIAAVSDPVASGLNTLPTNAISSCDPTDLSTTCLGDPMSAFTVTCDGATATTGSCSCTGFCTGVGSYSAAAMGLIVYGRDGSGRCGDENGEYFMGMCDLFAPILPQYVRVVYSQTGLGYAGRGPGPVPTIKVSLNAGAQKLPFRFFFLPFATINIPSMTTTITGEALSSAAAN